MIAYIVRRLLLSIVTVFIISIIVFSLIQLIPGDAAQVILGPDAEPSDVENLRIELGYYQPLVTQYYQWASGFFRGDWGTSIFYHVSVEKLIAERILISMHLGIIAIIFGNAVGIYLGIISAARRSSFWDSFIAVFTNLGISTPTFWLGILLVYLFGLKLGWLPIYGYTSPFTDFVFSTRQLIMPIIILAVMPIARAQRQTRSAMLEVIQQDYIRTAWAKGLSERVIMVRHALKIALIPVTTMMFLGVPVLVAGSVLTENVFNIPGMGRLLVQAAVNRDIVVVQACTMIIGIVVTLSNLAADITLSWLDPRIRYD